MNFSYVPVLKNRQAEKEALENQIMSNKILPLVEMVIEKPNIKSKGDFATAHEKFFENVNRPLLVDIPMYLNLTKKTKPTVMNFLNPIYQNQLLRIKYLMLLSSLRITSIIPVVSYNPNAPYIPNIITDQVKELRKCYNIVAFRIYNSYFRSAFDEINSNINEGDILLYDIGEKTYNVRPALEIYKAIKELKDTKAIKTVIIRSAIPHELKNTELIDNEVIDSIDNGIIDNYKSYGFDAFGDCAGIKRAEIEDIPASSPAYIYYYKDDNTFIGFKGVYNKLNTFTTMVLPKYTKSIYWSKLSISHKSKCYGCNMINKMLSFNQSANSASKWKTITIAHYISSIDEIL